MYFEDYAVDAVTVSRGRTITEADIVNFAGLSGDFVELHVNAEYAKSGPFGRRIAHGALIFSISTGSLMQMQHDPDAIVAFYGVDRMRFTAPVFIGDTITAEAEVTSVHATKPVTGLRIHVRRQDGEVVLDGEAWCYTFTPST